MQTLREQLNNGVVINSIFVDNFKTDFLTVKYVKKLDEDESTYISLLSQVLNRGTSRYGEMDKINFLLEQNYGAGLFTKVSKKGEAQVLSFTVYYLNDIFALNNELISKNIIELLNSVIFEPILDGDCFRDDIVEQEKQNLKDKIKAQFNDKQVYSLNKLKSIMFEKERYGVSELGDLQKIESITAETLYSYYKRFLDEAKIIIEFIGRPCNIIDLLKPLTSKMTKTNRAGIDTEVINNVSSVNTVVEKLNTQQSKLNLGFRLGENAQKDIFALKLFNVIYGSSPNSKLFLNVREKMSLCYYCASAIDPIKNVMFVYSGIEAGDYDKARDEIILQLDKFKNGEISQEEFNNAKSYLIDSYKSLNDSQMALASFVEDNELIGIDVNLEYHISEVSKLDIERVVNVAKGIKLDTVYFLKGEPGGAK